MPTLFLLAGLPGAGKTTRARELERGRPGSLLRLTPDEWIAALLRDPGDREEIDRLSDPVEALQWGVAARALALGLDVALDWGFWSRAERDDYRARAAALGARCVVEHPGAGLGLEALAARLAARNAAPPPGTFAVSRADLDRWAALFEPPTADELGAAEPGRAPAWEVVPGVGVGPVRLGMTRGEARRAAGGDPGARGLAVRFGPDGRCREIEARVFGEGVPRFTLFGRPAADLDPGVARALEAAGLLRALRWEATDDFYFALVVTAPPGPHRQNPGNPE